MTGTARTPVDEALSVQADPTPSAVVDLPRERPHRAGELAAARDMSDQRARLPITPSSADEDRCQPGPGDGDGGGAD